MLKITTSFNNRIASYRLPSAANATSADIPAFIEAARVKVENVMKTYIDTYRAIKLNIELFANYRKVSSGEEKIDLKSFITKYQACHHIGEYDALYTNILNISRKATTLR